MRLVCRLGLARARSRALLLLSLLACVGLRTGAAHAAPPAARPKPPVARAEPVPPALVPWIGWSLAGREQERCVSIRDVRTCVFPSALALAVDARDGSFTLRVFVEDPPAAVAHETSAAAAGASRFVRLPGSEAHFPLDVREGGAPIPVSLRDGSPGVWLVPGAHTLSGRFEFTALPDTLQLPPQLGVLELRVGATHVAFPKREASGLLWLKQSRDAGEEERLDLSVHRRIDDAIPLRVTTRVHVSAGGKGREVLLSQVLVPGTRPIELRAGLPVELSEAGALRLQVQAGEHDVEIIAVRAEDTRELRAPAAPAPWPEREIWVVKSDEQLRHLELSGPNQIDPARTDLAPDWRGLPTYVMEPSQALKLETRRRGEPDPAPNQLTLQRSLWLDLDGDGYTVRDQLGGSMQRGFRLDLLSAGLGHAMDHGQDQLITRHGQHAGVELRQRDVQLETEWRMEHGQRSLPAVGYNEDVHSLETNLNLPPGYTLLGAEGVDHVPGAWIDGWDLFDFFFVLLMALAVAKLCGVGFGVVALIALVLTHQEPDAPGASWVFLLAMTALSLALKHERVSRYLRATWLFALACVVLVLLPFSVTQVREALYPHLDNQAASSWGFGFGMAARPTMVLEEAQEALAPAEPPELEAAEEKAVGGGGAADLMDAVSNESDDGADSVAYSVAKRRASERAGAARARAYKLEIDPAAVVQTGPGVPNWNFRRYSLQWTGPVQKDQRIQLWLLPPLLTRAWSLASVLFSALLLLALARAGRRRSGQPPSEPPPASATKESLSTTYVGLVLLGLLGASTPAHAQGLPSPELLSELRERLLTPPPCAPRCLAVASLTLKLEPTRMSVSAEVHAQALAAYAAPGPLDSWAPDRVLVDGSDASGAVRSEDGFLHVRLEPGVHRVELSGPIPPSQAFTLALGDPPLHVRAEHKGFVVDGLRDDGRAEGSLSIRREVSQGAESTSASQGLAQWFEVRRRLDLGVRFRVHTSVTRLGSAAESALVRVPLLPGEEVSEAGLVTDQGSVIINLPRGETSLSYTSSLAPVPKLALRAPAASAQNGAPLQPLSEVWVVAPSALYRPKFEGIAPVLHVDAAGTYQPEYHPYPGEQLTVFANRLAGAEGASTTIDRAQVRFTPGTRLEQATVTLDLRTSRGSTERLKLPRDAQLHSVSVDRSARPARLSPDGKLEVRLDPGKHQVVISLQRPEGMAFSYRPFVLELERPLANVSTEVVMPEGRWLLFARGPAWGPAVLFWGYLLVVMLCAAVLGQLPLTPLKSYQWMLLGLGLTQVEAPVALIIVGWLFAIAYRERTWPKHPTVFNLTQVALVFLTVSALACLGYAVHSGLVVRPSMQVEGMGSSDQLLRWYADRTGGAFPDVGVWSAPLWLYKALMLLWALWLAALVIRWLRWSLFSLRNGGGWQPRKPRRPTAEPALAEGPAPAPVDAAADQGRPGPEGAGVP